MDFKLFLASPRGYCAGVKRAVEILDLALEKYKAPIYVNHEIIHNKFIINYFEKKGVIFGEKLENIKPGNIIIFSAHGVGPEFIKKVQKQKLKFIDASCPLVLKVHNKAKILIGNGYEIIYIGKKDHVEALGVKEENKEKIHIISNLNDLENLKNIFNKDSKLAILTQTTLSIDETKNLIEKAKIIFPNIELQKDSDICYATTNRQNAIKKLCEKVDILFIVGSKNSSNSMKLKEIGDKNGIPSFLLDSYKEIDEKIFENLINKNGTVNIGISGGASAPEKLIQEVIDYFLLKGAKNIEEIKIIDEKIIFQNNIELKS